MEMHRQGDVLFVRIDELPEGLTPREDQIIVEGEVTGHHHKLMTGRVLEAATGQLYLEVLRATQVVHQEHQPLALEPGYYQVVRQREYVAPELSRLVVD